MNSNPEYLSGFCEFEQVVPDHFHPLDCLEGPSPLVPRRIAGATYAVPSRANYPFAPNCSDIIQYPNNTRHVSQQSGLQQWAEVQHLRDQHMNWRAMRMEQMQEGMTTRTHPWRSQHYYRPLPESQAAFMPFFPNSVEQQFCPNRNISRLHPLGYATGNSSMEQFYE